MPDGRTDQRSLQERLAGKFEERGPDDCWPWKAAKDRRGYGRMTVRNESRLATHVILEANGFPRPAAPNNHALHLPSCGSSCSNPKHLRWGSHKENMQDKISAGTSHREGIIFNKSTLTEQDIRDIRASTLTLAELSELYDVSERSIWDIRKRRSWAWVQ